jgi:methylated-DNA-[protein]-cysteine S-methyltransferase
MLIASVNTPIGPLSVEEQGGVIVRVGWEWEREDRSEVLSEALKQLTAYFAGELTVFDLPLSVKGSEFQRKVCDIMLAIPFGETRTYGEIAKQIGAPAQPVGNACGANPIPVIIPCHRVLGASGLGGFSGMGGVETKVSLLKHEGAAGLLI